MQNVRPHPTSTPMHDTFFSVTFECDCPFLLQVDVAADIARDYIEDTEIPQRHLLPTTLNSLKLFTKIDCKLTS
jgi:hypothetical protein